MITLSDKANAIYALQQEYDRLLADSAAITEDQFVLAASFRNKMQALGLQQRKILDKMQVLEETMQSVINDGVGLQQLLTKEN